jgi:hypothetical protein
MQKLNVLTTEFPGIRMTTRIEHFDADEKFARLFVDDTIRWATASNREFKLNETIAIGFWLARFTQRGADVELWEMCPTTGEFHAGCRFAFESLRYQKTYCDMHQLAFEPVFAGHDAAVHQSVFEGADCRGWRHEASKGFSGWFFTSQARADFSDCKRVAIFELIKKRPDLIKVFGLPLGAGVLSPTVIIQEVT